MRTDFKWSIIFSSIDHFILALHRWDSQGFTLEHFSIEGPPCLLIRDFRYGAKQGNLLVIVSREMSTIKLFGRPILQLKQIDLDLTFLGEIDKVRSFWYDLKGKYVFLERTERGLRNRNNFNAEFIAKNWHWFTDS